MASYFSDGEKLSHQVRQFDFGLLSPSPLAGQSVLSALAAPSPKAVEAEADSLAAAQATGVENPSTVRAGLTSHSDWYKNWFDSWGVAPVGPLAGPATAHGDSYRDFFDSASIKRDYTG